MYLSAQCPPWSRDSFRRLCASQTPRPTPTHMCSLLWFFPPPHTAGTVHQRRTALPGSSGKHGGRHSLRRGRSDQQRPSAPQLRQGDQREADDLAFFSGEDNSSVQTVDDPSAAWRTHRHRVSLPAPQNESIINQATGRCLEVVPASVYFGHLLILQPCTGQRWTIKNTMKQ